jgi:hypothetical protein
VDKIANVKTRCDIVFETLHSHKGCLEGLEESAKQLEQKLEGYQDIEESHKPIKSEVSFNEALYAPGDAGSDEKQFENEDDEYGGCSCQLSKGSMRLGFGS